MHFPSELYVNPVIFGQGGTESGKDGKKKAKNAAGDSGGKAEVSCSIKRHKISIF